MRGRERPTAKPPARRCLDARRAARCSRGHTRGSAGEKERREWRPWPHRGCRVTAVGLGEEVEDVAAEGKKAGEGRRKQAGGVSAPARARLSGAPGGEGRRRAVGGDAAGAARGAAEGEGTGARG